MYSFLTERLSLKIEPLAAKHGPLSKHFLRTRKYENMFTTKVLRRLKTILLKVSAEIGGFLFSVRIKK